MSREAHPTLTPTGRSRRTAAARRLLGSAAVALALFATAAQAQPVDFTLAAQPLEAALREFAKQSGLQIAVSPELVKGKQAPAVSGRLEPEAALQRLLAGSGLAFQRQGSTVTLVRVAPTSSAEQQLPEVQVTAAEDRNVLPKPYAGGQVARGGRLGLLGNTDFMDAPFNITNYTAQTLEDQQVRSMAGVLANDPSVRVSSTNSTHNEAFLFRGFEIFTPDIALNGLYGLLPPHRVLTDFAERVEVLKGPSALLSGISPNGSIGGGINIVTKRAADEPLTRLTAGYISKGEATTHADIGRRFGADHQFGVRFNGVYRNGDTAMDGQSQQLSLGALGLDYRGEQLRLSLDAIWQNEHLDGGAEFGMRFSGAIPSAPRASTVLLPGSFSHVDNKTVVVRGEYDLTPDLTLFASYGRLDADRFVSLGAPLANAQGDFAASVSRERRYFDNDSGEAGVRSRFRTGSVQHQLVVSASGLATETGFAQTAGAARPSNIYASVPVLQPTTDPAGSPKTGRTRLNSVALADTLSFAEERVLLTLGVRRQQVKATNFSAATGAPTSDYDQSATTPMVGLVVKPAARLALYANYIEGLTQGPTAPTAVPGLTNPGQVFAPFKSKQYEAGVKVDFGRVATTLSVFQIARPNSITQNNTFSLDGEQRNRGIELNVFGEVARGVRVLGGAALLDGRVTKAATPALEDKKAIGVPDVQVNLGAEWDLPAVPRLTLHARGIYTSSQYVDAANTQTLPSWTRYDIGARYAAKIDGKPVVFRAYIENLLDTNYWSGVYGGGFVTLGGPRTFVLSATVDF